MGPYFEIEGRTRWLWALEVYKDLTVWGLYRLLALEVLYLVPPTKEGRGRSIYIANQSKKNASNGILFSLIATWKTQ